MFLRKANATCLRHKGICRNTFLKNIYRPLRYAETQSDVPSAQRNRSQYFSQKHLSPFTLCGNAKRRAFGTKEKRHAPAQRNLKEKC